MGFVGTASLALTTCLALGAAPASATEPALAGNPQLGAGANLSSVCSGCHAPGGVVIVDLHGYTSASVRALLMTYKTAADGGTVMHRLARGYSEQEITMIAEYVAGQ